MKAKIYKLKHYYIAFRGEDFEIINDKSIANNLNIKKESYQDYLIENYNAFVIDNETYFKSEEQAQEAADWIESFLIIQKLQSN